MINVTNITISDPNDRLFQAIPVQGNAKEPKPKNTVRRVTFLARSIIGLLSGVWLLLRATARGIVSALFANQIRKLYYPISMQTANVEALCGLRFISKAGKNFKSVFTAPSMDAEPLKIKNVFSIILWPNFEKLAARSKQYSVSQRDIIYNDLAETLDKSIE